MNETQWTGVAVVVLSGLIMGTSPWPLKLMRHFRYEHFAFLSMLLALVILPWAITLACCPEPFAALREVDRCVLLKANLFAFSWGIAQVLAMLCFVRIGVSLTYGILCSIGAAVGVIVPMIVKASGVFQQAPDLFSTPGMIILIGTFVMVCGVVFASLAGAGREKARHRSNNDSQGPKPIGGFAAGLMMVVAAGVLSVGWGFTFTYSQAPIVQAMKSHGAGDFPASIAVWAIALLGAALPNVLYPALLMTKNRSWHVLAEHPADLGLSIVYGILFFLPSVLLGEGMLRLGPLGASVGWGLVQGTLILGGQILGFLSGEWRGVEGKPRRQIYIAVALLIVAMSIMASAKQEQAHRYRAAERQSQNSRGPTARGMCRI
jgi:L-rhamnose-H+ transport protein